MTGYRFQLEWMGALRYVYCRHYPPVSKINKIHAIDFPANVEREFAAKSLERPLHTVITDMDTGEILDKNYLIA